MKIDSAAFNTQSTSLKIRNLSRCHKWVAILNTYWIFYICLYLSIYIYNVIRTLTERRFSVAVTVLSPRVIEAASNSCDDTCLYGSPYNNVNAQGVSNWQYLLKWLTRVKLPAAFHWEVYVKININKGKRCRYHESINSSVENCDLHF